MKFLLLIVFLFVANVYLLAEENLPIKLSETINSKHTELLPIISPDGKTLFFCRESSPDNLGFNYNNNDQDIWFSELDKEGNWKTAKNIGHVLNNSYPNYLCSITPDGNMALIGNTYFNNGNNFHGVCVTYKTKNGWTEPKLIKIKDFVNFNKYNEFCLAVDGKKLLMAIQNNESKGDKDIFVSFRLNDTVWGKPINLGLSINTDKAEISPFLAADDKTLYFASEGHEGFGMADLFVSRRLDSTWTNWSKPINLGNQINSEKWDAYFSLDAEGKWGYYSSYKEIAQQADIYKFKIPDTLRPYPVILINGKVRNQKTKEPLLANIIYEILPEGKEVGIARTNPQTGEYKITLPSGSKYGFRAESERFLSVSENIDLIELMRYDEITRDLELVPVEKGDAFVVNNLFFKYNDTILNPESYPELNRLADFLKNNSNVILNITGHTDNKGNIKYNLKLSFRRAASVATYLINKGVNSNRFVIDGKGRDFPKYPNDNEQNREKNRRVEMKLDFIDE